MRDLNRGADAHTVLHHKIVSEQAMEALVEEATRLVAGCLTG